MIVFECVSLTSPSGARLVDRLTLEVVPDATTVIFGASRATREALLGLVMKLERPDEGRITMDGVDIAGVDAPKLRRSIGWLSGPARLMPHMTVQDNVMASARLGGTHRRDAGAAASAMLNTVGVTRTDCLPAELSTAERVRVGLARSFVGEPQLVVLNEPLAGVDAGERSALRPMIRRLREDCGATLLVATGHASDALALADRLVILLEGKLVQSGSPADVLARPAPGVEALFGHSAGLRSLGFVTIEHVPVDASTLVRVGAPAYEARRIARGRDSAWLLIVDDDGRPLGWIDTERLSGTGPVTEVPLVAVRGTVTSSDSMERALDCIISSPAQAAVKLDDNGCAEGLLSYVDLAPFLPGDGHP